MEKIIINIDSNFRDLKKYPISSKFSLILDKAIKNVTDIEITSVEFSNLYNTFSSLKNNTYFKLKYNTPTPISIPTSIITTTSLTNTILIPNEVYSINNVIDIINSQLKLIYNYINIRYNDGIVIISSNFKFTLDFTNSSNKPSLGSLLGFTNNIYNITTPDLSVDNYGYNIYSISSEIKTINENTIYNFNSSLNNNSFNFTYDYPVINSTPIISISNKNYKAEDLITDIQTNLNIFNSSFINFQINLDYNTNKIKISSNTFFNIDFTNTGNYSSLGYQLGFRNNIYNNPYKDNTSTTPLYYIIGEVELNVISNNYLFLKINDYGNLYTNFLNDQKYILSSKNILGKIILNSNSSNINDNNSFICKKYLFRQPVNINKFDIELINSDGDTVKGLNLDYSFTLEITYIYNSKEYLLPPN
jgi:hypothetical protein